MKEKIYCWLAKLDRLAAWTLLIVVLLFAISGYGLTKGLIDRQLASSLHLYWLMPIGFLAFIAHVGWAVHLACKRWRIWNLATKTILALLGVALAAGFIYANYFYNASGQQRGSVPEPKELQGQAPNGTATATAEGVAATEIFTKEQLSRYDGKNGNPAYVAIDGKVYDASSVFRNGLHYGYSAGQDLSKEFHGKHPDQFLNKLRLIGAYAD